MITAVRVSLNLAELCIALGVAAGLGLVAGLFLAWRWR